MIGVLSQCMNDERSMLRLGEEIGQAKTDRRRQIWDDSIPRFICKASNPGFGILIRMSRIQINRVIF